MSLPIFPPFFVVTLYKASVQTKPFGYKRLGASSPWNLSGNLTKTGYSAASVNVPNKTFKLLNMNNLRLLCSSLTGLGMELANIRLSRVTLGALNQSEI